jgi:hypothetical protein
VDPTGRPEYDALKNAFALAAIANWRRLYCPEVIMNQTATLPFERAVHEFVRWRAVPEDVRSPAPAWWWGPAFEARDIQQTMPEAWCSGLGLPNGATVASGADVLLKSLGDQTSLPWTGDFPHKAPSSIPSGEI